MTTKDADAVGPALRHIRLCGLLALFVLAGPVPALPATAAGSAAPTAAAELVQQADALLDKGRRNPTDLDLAHDRILAAIKLDPKLASAHYALARYYEISGENIENGSYRPGSLEKALAAAQESVRADPGFSEGYVLSGYLQRRLGHYDLAQQALDQARELHSQSAWLDLNQAELYEDQDRLGDGIANASRVVSRGDEAGPALWHGYRALLRMYCKQEDKAAADALYQEQKKRYPDDAWIPGNYALYLLYYMGDFKEAAAQAREALAMRQSFTFKRTLGLALYGQWATMVLHHQDAEAAGKIFDEADAEYSLIILNADPALEEPKLKLIADALTATNQSMKSQGAFRFLLSYMGRRMFKGQAASGQDGPGLSWQLGALAAIVIALILFGRRKTAVVAQPRPPAVSAPALAPVDVPSQPLLPESFRFTGNGAEYFRIWIVNLLLTILTLGLYSPWAKVRKLKYFHRNTELAGSRFDYHGEPVAILKGRLVAVALVFAYQWAFKISPAAGFSTLLVLAVVLPWLLRNSLRFRLHNTSYRGIRFRFSGTQAGAYYVFLVGSVVSLITLYTLAPLYHQRLKAYQHGHAHFGTTSFSFDRSVPGFKATSWGFYKIYLGGFGLLLGAMILGGIGIGITVAAFSGKAGGKPGTGPVMAIAFALYAFMILVVAPYFVSRLQNLVWNNTRLGPHRFASSLAATRLFWIYLTNLLGIVATLGFFAPWASVRLARYKMQSMQLIPGTALDATAAAADQDVGAAGQETAEFFDIDIAM